MMGFQSDQQPKLFYPSINLEERVRRDHVLRRIAGMIDFEFIYDEVREHYGDNGNVSVPPPVILKLMLLLVLYNVRSERELMQTLPERLDWLWFLGYDLESSVPDHSVLSKARCRWGRQAFQRFFERIVGQCVQAGLVDGRKLFIDASLIEADASNNSVVDTRGLGRHLSEGYRRLEQRLETLEEQKTTAANSRFISTTDPEASVIRHAGGRSRLRYKTHRTVDPSHEVIISTRVTPGARDDGDLLAEMIDAHERNTGRPVETVVGDSKYGTKSNYLLCHDRGIAAHMPSLERAQSDSGRREGMLPRELFAWEAGTDTLICPAGEVLRKSSTHRALEQDNYRIAAQTCKACPLKSSCTRSEAGRSVKRHRRQPELDQMLREAASPEAKRDRRTRRHLSERSFARSVRLGYKRARWRGLGRMAIQDYLVAAVQNLLVLISPKGIRLSKSNAAAVPERDPAAWAVDVGLPLRWLLLIFLHPRRSGLRWYPC